MAYTHLRFLTSLCFPLTTLACEAPPQAPPSSPLPASETAAAAPDAPASAAPARSSAPSTTAGSRATVAIAALLDPEKGKRALSDYRVRLKERCSSPAPIAAWPGSSAPERDMLCGDPSNTGRALASGALLEAGADEVVLDVPSGLAGAEGDHALMLMRRQGASYRMVHPMALGRGFDAHARVTTASTDVLLVCAHEGNMGYHPRTCGFLGQGTFAGTANSSADPAARLHELRALAVSTCGKGASVELGAASVDGARLRVPLVLEYFVREPQGDDVGDFCSRKRVTQTRMLSVDYRIEGARAVRVTPALAEVDRIMDGG